MKCNQIEWIWSDFGANRLKWSNLSILMYVVWHTHPLWRFQRASWPCSSSLPCLLDCWRARSGALHLSTHSEAQDTPFLTLSQCPRLACLRKWKQAPSAHRMQHHSSRPFWAACKWRVPLLCSVRHIWQPGEWRQVPVIWAPSIGWFQQNGRGCSFHLYLVCQEPTKYWNTVKSISGKDRSEAYFGVRLWMNGGEVDKEDSRLLYYLIREIKTWLNVNHITVHNNTYCTNILKLNRYWKYKMI